MLPSTRRPREVEEEIAARVAAEMAKKSEQEKIVYRTSMAEIFMKTMCEFYETLSDEERKRFTPIKLKRKAVQVCFANKIDYYGLPADWVDELMSKSGMKLYRPKEIKRKNKTGESANAGGKQMSMDSSKDLNVTGRRSRASREESEDADEASSGQQDQDSSPGKTTKAETETVDGQTVATKQPEGSKNGKKRFLDLSTIQPPAVWLQHYAKGVELPRVLTLYSAEDVNILFYDYNPKLKDSLGREVKLTPKPRSSVYAAEELRKPKEKTKKKDRKEVEANSKLKLATKSPKLRIGQGPGEPEVVDLASDE